MRKDLQLLIVQIVNILGPQMFEDFEGTRLLYKNEKEPKSRSYFQFPEIDLNWESVDEEEMDDVLFF